MGTDETTNSQPCAKTWEVSTTVWPGKTNCFLESVKVWVMVWGKSNPAFQKHYNFGCWVTLKTVKWTSPPFNHSPSRIWVSQERNLVSKLDTSVFLWKIEPYSLLLQNSSSHTKPRGWFSWSSKHFTSLTRQPQSSLTHCWSLFSSLIHPPKHEWNENKIRAVKESFKREQNQKTFSISDTEVCSSTAGHTAKTQHTQKTLEVY